MPINFENIKQQGVVIELVMGLPLVNVHFARIPDPDVLTDLLAIRGIPGIKIYTESDVYYKLWLPPTISVIGVAKEIKRMMSEDHRLDTKIQNVNGEAIAPSMEHKYA